MKMNRKHLSVIILTTVFAVSLIICIIISNIEVSHKTSPETDAPTVTDATDTQTVEIGDTTVVVKTDTTASGGSSTNNILDDIMDDLYDKNRPVIISPTYGSNVNNGSEGYELDGQAVTTVYDTVESTSNGETTTAPEPEETTNASKKDTTKTPEETTGLENSNNESVPTDNSEGAMLSEGD